MIPSLIFTIVLSLYSRVLVSKDFVEFQLPHQLYEPRDCYIDTGKYKNRASLNWDSIINWGELMAIRPIVGIITNETIGFNGRQLSHSTGKRYVDAVMKFAQVVPILIPTCIEIFTIAYIFRVRRWVLILIDWLLEVSVFVKIRI